MVGPYKGASPPAILLPDDDRGRTTAELSQALNRQYANPWV